MLDSVKKAQTLVTSNMIGTLAGAVGGVMLVNKFSPMKGLAFKAGGALLGAVAGAFAQSKVSAKVGLRKSVATAKS